MEAIMWYPPKYGLIQERYWPDEWKILVCCLCLNLTTRKQMEPVMEVLFRRWPDAQSLSQANDGDLEDVIKTLGMQKKRTQTLKRMSSQFHARQWKDVSDLHGVGKYASDAYRIFILGDWRNVEPKDHALNAYHDHLKNLYLGSDHTPVC
jgi:methyl-CpG-binding domain protein 4